MVTWLELLAYKITRHKMLSHSKLYTYVYKSKLGVRDMASEWKDHVATIAREIDAEKETVPYGYDDLRDEHTMFVQDVDADLKKYWHATQGDKR